MRKPPDSKPPQMDYGQAAYAAIQEVVGPLRTEDPVIRFEGATAILTSLNDAIGLAATQRRSAVRQMRAEGWTQRDIGRVFNLTPARIAQIEAGTTQPRRKKP